LDHVTHQGSRFLRNAAQQGGQFGEDQAIEAYATFKYYNGKKNAALRACRQPKKALEFAREQRIGRGNRRQTLPLAREKGV